jgi:hypothetical protein
MKDSHLQSAKKPVIPTPTQPRWTADGYGEMPHISHVSTLYMCHTAAALPYG